MSFSLNQIYKSISSLFSNPAQPVANGNSAKRSLTISEEEVKGKRMKFNAEGPEFPRVSLDYQKLMEFYRIDFVSPIDVKQNQELIEIREQILQIEEYILNHFSSNTEILLLKNKIKFILSLSTLSTEKKMGELGVIYYYLTQDKLFAEISETFSFISFLQNEVSQELKNLENHHLEIVGKKFINKIPSTKTQHLLHKLAEIILTPEQKLNRGALFALIHILSCTDGKIPLYFKPEHLDHILHVLKQLHSKPQLKQLLENRTYTVHDDLKILIRLDLKLSPLEPILPLHIMRSNLISLFFDPRQDNSEPNCYAFSSLIYSIENGTFKFLFYMLNWLKNGYYSGHSSPRIPILPLVEKRLIYEDELEIKLPISNACNLTIFKKIANILDINIENKLITSNTLMPLHKSLLLFLRKHYAEHNFFYAKQFFYSFSHNFLLRMAVTIIEFQYINFYNIKNKLSLYSEKKEKFIRFILHRIKQMLPLTYETKEKEKFIFQLQKKIEKNLWFDNYNERQINRKKTKIIFGPSHDNYTIDNNGENIEVLTHVISQSFRVFSLTSGRYCLLKTFSDLQHELIILIQQVVNELNEGFNINSVISQLKDKSFKEKVAKYCASQINQFKINGSTLSKMNFLLFFQNGGYSESSLDHLFGLSYSTFERRPKSAYQFMLHLYNFFSKKIDPSILSNTNQFILCSKLHAFTLSLKKLSHLWTSANPIYFKNFMKSTQFGPAKKFLDKKVPMEVIKRVLKRFMKESKSGITLIIPHRYKNTSLKYASLHQVLLLQMISPDDFQLIREIIDQEFFKISLSYSEVEQISNKLDFLFCSKTIEKIITELNIKFKGEWVYPFQIGYKFRKILIELGYPLQDPYVLEKAICEVKGLPLPFDIGDMNWLVTEKENPGHLRFIIRYHFGYQNVEYFTRSKDEETLDKIKEYTEMQIIYPTM